MLAEKSIKKLKMVNKKMNFSVASIHLLEEVTTNLQILEDLKEFDDNSPEGRASSQTQYKDGAYEALLVVEDGPGLNLE